MGKVTNHTLAALDQTIQALPDGTTVNILWQDFVNGNFDTCEIVFPEGAGYSTTHHTLALCVVAMSAHLSMSKTNSG